MFIKHRVLGSRVTSFHNFSFRQEGMSLFMSEGEYIQKSHTLFKLEEELEIKLEMASEITEYDVWVTHDGVVVIMRTDGEDFNTVDNSIDRLAWFTVPAKTTSLDNVNIHLVVMQDER